VEVNAAVRTTVHVSVHEASQVAEARRAALALAVAIGLAQATRDNLALLVTEAATNLVKHADRGECVVRTLPASGGERRGLEILCIDRGPGISDLAACMRDGFSTAGSPGSGLGAMRRLATSVDIYSVPGQGTALALELWEGDAPPAAARLRIGALSVPRRGERECGDNWSASDPAAEMLLIVDGLGHGPIAAQASQCAIAAFAGTAEREPEHQIETLHRALRATRGAAAAVVRIDREHGSVRYCGVGNTVGALFHADGIERMVSQPGTLGSGVVRTRPFEYRWTPSTTLVLHTDGVSSRWDLSRYPGILARHPSLLAALLYRDFGRAHDDATVVVARAA